MAGLGPSSNVSASVLPRPVRRTVGPNNCAPGAMAPQAATPAPALFSHADPSGATAADGGLVSGFCPRSDYRIHLIDTEPCPRTNGHCNGRYLRVIISP